MQKEITEIEQIEEAYRWKAVARAIENMVRVREDVDLSEASFQTDPKGELILTLQTYNGLTSELDVYKTISYIGSTPYRQAHLQEPNWYMMCGSFLHLGFNLSKTKLVTKSYYNVLTAGCGDFGLVLGGQAYEQGGSSKKWLPKLSFAISTETIAKYFLRNCTPAQRVWLVRSMLAEPTFEINDIPDIGQRIAVSYNSNIPDLRREPADCSELQMTTPRRHGEKGHSITGPRNGSSDAEVDETWLKIIDKNSIERIRARNRLLRSLHACDSICTNAQRPILLKQARAGQINALLAMIDNLVCADSFAGRGYKSKQYDSVWGWLQTEVYARGEGRCQHCGKNGDDLMDPYLHVDHIVPLSKSGKTQLSNLQLLCSTCNSKKARNIEDSFAQDIRSSWYKNRLVKENRDSISGS